MVLLKEKPVDLMIVIGGYNSSNTCNLARMCAEKVPTFHIADPECLESADAIRYRPAGGKGEVAGRPDGCPPAGTVSVGLTSGASTPDNLVGTTVSDWPSSAGSRVGAACLPKPRSGEGG